MGKTTTYPRYVIHQNKAVTKQPMPKSSFLKSLLSKGVLTKRLLSKRQKAERQEVLPSVIMDLTDRVEYGKKEYGEPLKTFNSRDALWDAYQEALDLVMYLRQAILEKENEVKKKI